VQFPSLTPPRQYQCGPAATLLLAQGVDPRTIMETLGHSQISLTLNTYSHVLPALQAEAAAKLDAILTR
jgi:integrase